MGTPDAYLYRSLIADETPEHPVVISKSFYLSRYPVTQGQWQAVMSPQSCQFQDEHRPVQDASWNDAQAFLQNLNKREGMSDYRLPTEAEWEYACRAGTTTRYHFGDDEAQLGEYAWYDENSGGKTHPVGQKKPNAWGLYDMHGHVVEWVQDWYGLYSAHAVIDPRGPDRGVLRVLRGGSCFTGSWRARSAQRFARLPGYSYSAFGFRVAQGQVGQ